MDRRLLALIIVSIIAASYLRLANLGYSNFQGDEVSAQNFLFGEMSLKNFLLTRNTPPGQYLVSFIANSVFKNWDPHVRVRLPFCVASILTALFMALTQKKKSILAIILWGLSGLMIAFARIVQYQSFIMLFGIASVFLIKEYVEKDRHAYLTLAALLSATALLFHYDALSFLLPISLFLLIKKDYKGLAKYVLIIIAITAIFYVPFMRREEFQKTYDYLTQQRIGPAMPQDTVGDSLEILRIYHSKEYVFLFGIIVVLYGLTRLVKTNPFFGGLTILLISLRALSQQRNTVLVYTSIGAFLAYGIAYLIKMQKKGELGSDVLIELWFYVSFLFYGLIIQRPLTHIYTFLLPLFLVLSQTFFKNKIIFGLTTILVISSVSFNYQAFIDTKKEYPWESKRYIFGDMPQDIAEGKIVAGIFGFPYFRNWQEIGDTSRNLKEEGYESYFSNEKYRISKYYMQGIRWEEVNPDFYIFIENPQSLSASPPPKNLEIIEEGEMYTIYQGPEITHPSKF